MRRTWATDKVRLLCQKHSGKKAEIHIEKSGSSLLFSPGKIAVPKRETQIRRNCRDLKYTLSFQNFAVDFDIEVE